MFIRLFIFSILLVTLCSNSTIKMGAKADENTIKIANMKRGMSERQVLTCMGCPDKTETKIQNDQVYVVWYYLTKGTLLGQRRLGPRNLTPFIFKDGVLIGWGREFYKYHFNVDKERHKRAEQYRQRYTDNKDEWPPNEHKIILPPGKNNKEIEKQTAMLFPVPRISR